VEAPGRPRSSEAVEELTDPFVLEQIAQGEWDVEVRVAAIERVEDQALLLDIGKNDEDRRASTAAVKRLTDQGGLTDIAKNCKHISVRVAAVERMTDLILAQIAKDDEDCRVRLEAVCRLTDQIALIDIIMNHTDPAVCSAAVRLVTDPSLLADIAKKGKVDDLRKAAAKRLDPALHAKLLRVLSADRFTPESEKDPSVLGQIARWAFDWCAREGAVKRVTDHGLVADIAKHDKEQWVRRAAVYRVTDQSLLADIASNDRSIHVCRAAVERVTDPAARDRLHVEVELRCLGFSDGESRISTERVRKEAAERLIALARENPTAIRARWEEIAGRVQHSDKRGSHSDDGCQGPHGDHADRGLHGITFPPKPTDF
jgi:hypothetical protein